MMLRAISQRISGGYGRKYFFFVGQSGEVRDELRGAIEVCESELGCEMGDEPVL